MSYSLIIFLLAFIGPGDIGKVNMEKSAAKDAYQRGEFKAAVTHYKTLIDSLGVKEDEVAMNLAHAYFQLNDTLNAQNSYLPLTGSSTSRFRSLANQQLGVLANRQGKFEEALNYFKNSLKADPANEEARYNYEMVKKKLEEKKKQEQQDKDQKQDDQKKDDQKKDQKENKDRKEKNEQQKKDDKEKRDKDKQDQKNKDRQQQKEEQQKKEKELNKENDKTDIPPSVSEKLKEMKMSEDKARMVLEAMKNQEVQYLQQNKRKATKPRSRGKPDW